MRGNAIRRPDFQRTKASHAADLAQWLAMATDPVFNVTTLDTLEQRHGGKGGLSRKEIEYHHAIAAQNRAAR